MSISVKTLPWSVTRKTTLGSRAPRSMPISSHWDGLGSGVRRRSVATSKAGAVGLSDRFQEHLGPGSAELAPSIFLDEPGGLEAPEEPDGVRLVDARPQDEYPLRDVLGGVREEEPRHAGGAGPHDGTRPTGAPEAVRLSVHVDVEARGGDAARGSSGARALTRRGVGARSSGCRRARSSPPRWAYRSARAPRSPGWSRPCGSSSPAGGRRA